ncbi:MAG: 1-acyl-sn-glycerol-3-phosphate acyltransferase [Bacteroidetes bacterium]|nr:1-acyl-sn-glycerol-3-phosphate acyltransferase [Bacteroidota bacterium]
MIGISRFILRLFGWKIIGPFPHEYKKSVLIMAPHTSMWDFILGRLGFNVLGAKARFLIKKEMFKFPLRHILTWMGGLPVDRQKNNNMVDNVSSLYETHDSLCIVITPEGTRKRVEHWKKGFYYIALKARVPIILGFLDYEKKEGGVGPIVWPSGNFQEDFRKIEDYYRGKKGRHPEMFNLE